VTPNQVKVRAVEVEKSIEMIYHRLSQLKSPKKRLSSKSRRKRRSRRKNKKRRSLQKSLTKSKIRKLKRKRHQIQRLKKKQMENLKQIFKNRNRMLPMPNRTMTRNNLIQQQI
jgi:hypothetical protein